MPLRELPIWLVVLLVTIAAAWMAFGGEAPDEPLGGLLLASAGSEALIMTLTVRGP